MRGLGRILARSTMSGLGVTYSFVPRRRGLRGLGQTDPVSGLPCSDPGANCPPFDYTPPAPIIPAPTTVPVTPPDLGPSFPATPPSLGPQPPGPTLPPGFFTPGKPIVPPPRTVPVTPPVITPSFPSAPPGIQIVFPSGGGTARPLAAPAGWLEQTTGGFPNKYLALFGIGAVFMLSISSGARRR
jgi:hypothetical protein